MTTNYFTLMAKISHDTAYVQSSELLDKTIRLFCAHGVSEADAKIVAWHLVETNLRGTDSHGVARVPHYLRRIEAGSINPRPEISFQQVAPSLGVMDGGNGLGHLVVKHACEEAAKLAEKSGAGWVAVRNSSHCGALAPFGLELAKRGFIFFGFTHVDPMVLPHGSREPFCGTNPICITVPGADGKHLSFDMATSVVPWNLVANAANEGISIPQGWGVDADGRDTTDPKQINALYPVGGYKGSGLGLMIDVLCSMLVGAPYGPDIPKMYGDLSRPRQLGGLVGVIDIKPFTDPEQLKARVLELAQRYSSLTPAEGFDRVQFPGQPEIEAQRERERNGIPIGLRTLEDLNEQMVKAGIAPLEEYHGAKQQA